MATQQTEDPERFSPSELEGLSRGDVLRASPRMFDSELLDKLSRVHPSVPPILFGPLIAFMLVEGVIRGAGWLTILYLLGGYLFWTLTEYWLHRIVFHFEPEAGIGARLHWIIHGVHHDHPNDPMRLVMPPSLSIPLAALFIFGFYLIAGDPAYLPSGRASWPATWPTTCSITTCTTTGPRPPSAGDCASCICVTTSRTTTAAMGSARRSGITSLAPRQRSLRRKRPRRLRRPRPSAADLRRLSGPARPGRGKRSGRDSNPRATLNAAGCFQGSCNQPDSATAPSLYVLLSVTPRRPARHS
jgi:hypothetical protein